MATHIMDSTACALSSFFLVFAVYKVLEPKKITKYFTAFIPLLVGSSYYFFIYSSFMTTRIANPSIRQHFVFLTMFLSYLIYVAFLFTAEIKEKMQAFAGLWAAAALSEFTVVIPMAMLNLAGFASKQLPFTEKLIQVSVVLALYALNCHVFSTRFGRHKTKFPWQVYLCSLLIFLSLMFLILLVLDSPVFNQSYSKVVICLSFFCAAVLIIALSYILKYMSGQEKLKEKIAAAQEMQELDVKHIQTLYEKAEETRRIQHDWKDNLSILQLLLQNGSPESLEKANSFIDELTQNITSSKISFYTNNVLVNTVLSSKIDEAKRNGITVDAKVTIAADISKISELDINILIINLFNNAIEACQKVADADQKAISFRLATKGNYLLFKISNPYQKLHTDKNGKLKTTKQDKEKHGIGLAIIESLSKKYNGEEHISTENQIFTHTVSLDLEAEPQKAEG